MKSINFLLLAILTFAVGCNCQPKQFSGTIVDATMNTVVVKELTSDQMATFSTEDADMTAAYGMLLGNLITVDYKGKMQEVTPATKVATDATYAKAVGDWTIPDPINPDSSVMGVRLMIEGAAESINMATLCYTGWELQGEQNKILLRGVSEGSGEPIEFSQIVALGANAEGAETLTIDPEFVLIKQTI